jgi:putative membrane protein
MRVLVLCVDRDNDFGEKVKVKSPIIGRHANLRAALALILTDPEDTDANSLFGAIRLYDNLKRGHHHIDVEIATICGDRRVGLVSDRKLVNQLEAVLTATKPDRIKLVSDGAEDEFILPMLTSRVKTDPVTRVIVKQSKTVESTYYLIMRILSDEKILKKFVVPASIIFLLLGITAVFGLSYLGIGILFLVLGIYGIIKAYHLEEPALAIVKDFKTSLERGYVSKLISIIAAAIIIFGVVRSYLYMLLNPTGSLALDVIYFFCRPVTTTGCLWLIIGGIWLYVAGKSIDVFIRTDKFHPGIITATMFLFAAGFITMATFEIAYCVIDPSQIQTYLHEIFLYILTGSFLGFFGLVVYHYLKQI